MIRNKRALVRMLEAIIAIMILLGFFIFIMSKQVEKPNIAEDIYKLERKILREAADNLDIREAVLSEDPEDYTTVESFIADRLYPTHSALNFSIAICEPPGQDCRGPRLTADIYVDDIVIGSILREERPEKILRLFIWVGVARKVEAPPEAECGNGDCESGEDCENCPDDCPCALGEECIDGVCTPVVPECTPGWKCHGVFYGYQDGGCTWSQETCSVACGANCEAGQTQECWTYTGPIEVEYFKSASHPKTICEKGTKACVASTCEWSTCGGEVWPIEESGWGTPGCINGDDDDCDGAIDEEDSGCGF